jgi:hypothetical protein
MTAADDPPRAGGVSQLCRAALLVAVGRSLFSSGGWVNCQLLLHGGGKFGGGRKEFINANVDGGEIDLLTQVSSLYYFCLQRV